MTITTLETFTHGWRRACKAQRVPTMEELASKGAPIDHPGFALIGHADVKDASTSSAKQISSPPMFQFLEAGQDHFTMAGGIKAGDKLDALVHPATLTRLVELYEKIASGSQPHRWRCTNMVRNAPVISYSRVLAPVHDDVGDGRCLAGVWIWKPISDS